MLSVADQLKSEIDVILAKRQTYVDLIEEIDSKLKSILSGMHPLRKGRGGRPKGSISSVSKPKPSKRGRPDGDVLDKPRKIGRPKGSKNKPKVPPETPQIPQPENVAVAKLGRPKKNEQA